MSVSALDAAKLTTAEAAVSPCAEDEKQNASDSKEVADCSKAIQILGPLLAEARKASIDPQVRDAIAIELAGVYFARASSELNTPARSKAISDDTRRANVLARQVASNGLLGAAGTAYALTIVGETDLPVARVAACRRAHETASATAVITDCSYVIQKLTAIESEWRKLHLEDINKNIAAEFSMTLAEMLFYRGLAEQKVGQDYRARADLAGARDRASAIIRSGNLGSESQGLAQAIIDERQ